MKQQLWEQPVDMSVLYPVFSALSTEKGVCMSVYICIIMCSLVIKGVGGSISQPQEGVCDCVPSNGKGVVDHTFHVHVIVVCVYTCTCMHVLLSVYTCICW